LLGKEIPCSKFGSHSVSYYENKYGNISGNQNWTIEAFVVMWADEIAQRHHDVVDGIQNRILVPQQIYDILAEVFDKELEGYKKDIKAISNVNFEKTDSQFVITDFSRWIVNFYVNKISELFKKEMEAIRKEIGSNTDEALLAYKKSADEKQIKKRFSFKETDFGKMNDSLQEKLRNYILNSYEAQRMDGRGDYIVRKLFEAFLTNPQQMSDGPVRRLANELSIQDPNIGNIRNMLKDSHNKGRTSTYKSALCRTITDYIASMTDQYAITKFQSLYGMKL
jgi:dGTPase